MIQAPRGAVWAALTDSVVVQRCIAGGSSNHGVPEDRLHFGEFVPGPNGALKADIDGGAGGELARSITLVLDAEEDATRITSSVDAQADPALEDGLAEFFSQLNAELSEDKLSAEVYEPSKQWVIWAFMFGILLLAVVLTL